MKNKKGIDVLLSTVIFFAIVGLLLIIAAVLTIWYDFGFSVGSGKQAGIISEVERSGVFFRQPEITLLNIQPTYSERDTFYKYGASESIAQLAELYSENNTQVIVYYDVKGIVYKGEYSHRVIITKIEPIEN